MAYINRAGTPPPIQPPRTERPASPATPPSPTRSVPSPVTGALAGLGSLTRAGQTPREMQRAKPNTLPPKFAILPTRDDPKRLALKNAREVRAAASATIDAPHITTLLSFDAARKVIEGLDQQVRGEPLAVLGTRILLLPEAEQQAALNGFLADAKKHLGPRPLLLDELLNAPVELGRSTPYCLKSRESDLYGYGDGPVSKAAKAAMEPGGTGEFWHEVADRMGMVTNSRMAVEFAVARGPAAAAAVAAMKPDGTGELWHKVAGRMHITSQDPQEEVELAVAQGPATQAVLAAMQANGSSEPWRDVAGRMEITGKKAWQEIRNTANNAITKAAVAAMAPGGSGELWTELADRMKITTSGPQKSDWGPDLGPREEIELAVAKGPAAQAAIAAMEPGGSGEFWHDVVDRMQITTLDPRDVNGDPTAGPKDASLNWTKGPRETVELAVARGPATRATIAALEANGSGESGDEVANRMKIVGKEARKIVIDAANDAIMKAAVAAMEPGGSGELWHELADRMKLPANSHMRWTMEAQVASGPAAAAAVAAMEPGGSGEFWQKIASDMGVTNSVAQAFIETAVADGPVRKAIDAASQPGGSGDAWQKVAGDMGIINREPLLRLDPKGPGSYFDIQNLR